MPAHDPGDAGFAGQVHDKLSGWWSKLSRSGPAQEVVEVADKFDSGVASLSEKLREQLANTSWLPDAIRPDPPRRGLARRVPGGVGNREMGIVEWVKENKALSAGLFVVGLTATGYAVQKIRRSHRRRRRAHRAANGARSEVLIVVGDVAGDELCRAVVMDLERRGFIVFVVAGNVEDERMVRELGKKDIGSIKLDPLDYETTSRTLHSFTHFLSTPQRPSNALPPSTHHLTGVLLFPASSYPTGPIELLPPSTLSSTLTSNLLTPLLQTQFLIPLMRQYRASLTILSPSIIRSTTPAFHAPEAIITSALEAWAKTLSREVRSAGVSVCRVRIGNVDFTKKRRREAGDVGEVRGLLGRPEDDETVKDVYARRFRQVVKAKGTPIKDICRQVFDIVEDGKSGSQYVGRGSWFYEWVGWGVGIWGKDVDDDGWEQV